MCNTGVTNVPGPRTPIYLSGAQVVDVYGFALVAPGVGLVNMISSYCGNVTIGFQAATAVMADPQRYEDCLMSAFDELVEAAL